MTVYLSKMAATMVGPSTRIAPPTLDAELWRDF